MMSRTRNAPELQATTGEESLEPVILRICDLHARRVGKRAALLGLSGIDASGKGYVASRLGQLLAGA